MILGVVLLVEQRERGGVEDFLDVGGRGAAALFEAVRDVQLVGAPARE